MTSQTTLPPGVWKCHGYHLAARATCPTCGRTSAQKLSDVWIPADSRGIDTADRVNTLEQSQSGRNGLLKRYSSGLNNTEQRFADWVKTWPNAPVLTIPHPLPGIPLTDGDSYRPDFLLIFDGRLYQYCEVKGSHAGRHIAWSERGIEKFKRARAEHPRLCFGMFVWDGKEWQTK